MPQHRRRTDAGFFPEVLDEALFLRHPSPSKVVWVHTSLSVLLTTRPIAPLDKES